MAAPAATETSPGGGGTAGALVLVAGLALIALCAGALVLTGNGGVRYSADHGDTIPFWHRWIPALVGIALVRSIPWRPEYLRGQQPVARSRPALRIEALVLLAAAVLFVLLLRLAGGGEPTTTLLKLLLLLGVPAALFRVVRRAHPAGTVAGGREAAGRWRRWGPVVPVTAWGLLAYAGPFAVPSGNLPEGDAVTLIAIVAVGFALNSVLEEVFYRRWLQSRWEVLLGPWPAVVLASLLWAVWHIGIQGTGSLPVDVASVIAGHGVQGLFLGYLWSRYRMMWPVLAVHGAMNAAGILVALV